MHARCRIACNINQDAHRLPKGAWLVSAKSLHVGRVFDAQVAWLAHNESPLRRRRSLSVHIGVNHALADVHADGYIEVGTKGTARIRLDRAIPLPPDGRFVLRGERIQGFGTIVGGGRILDPKPPRRRRADWRRTLCCPSADKVDILTREAGRNGLELSYIAQRIVGARSMNTRRFYADLVEKEQARIVSKLTKHHEAHPFAEGLAIKELVTDKLSEFIVGEAISTGAIVRSGAYLSFRRESLVSIRQSRACPKIMRAIGRSGLTALSRNQLFERFPADRN